MLIYILTLLFLAVSLIEALFLIYYFQIKEYRFDRLGSYFKEKGLLFFLFPERFYLPKRSVRNRNIIIIYIILTLIYFSYLVFAVKSSQIKLILLVFSPVFNIFWIILGVLYTERIVRRKRGYVISEAQEKVKNSKAVFIGITGSFGKTSTKEFLYELLGSKFKVARTDENQNTDIGIAMSINKNLKEGTEIFIFEVGAYKMGEIKKVVDWVKPKYGILTGLGNQHLSLFGSFENLIEAKSELLRAIPSDGIVYINKDCDGYKESAKGLDSKVHFYSAGNGKVGNGKDEKEADIYLKHYGSDRGHIKFTVSYKDRDMDFEVKLLGRHNVLNLLPCIALALDLGIEEGLLRDKLSKLEQFYGRLSLHRGINKSSFLNDSYSSNLQGFLSALNVLNELKAKRKVVVTKGIIELGKDKESSYKKIVEVANRVGVHILTTDQALKSMGNKITTLFRSEGKILDYLTKSLKEDDLALIEGRFSDNFISGLELK